VQPKYGVAGFDVLPNNPKFFDSWSPDDFVNAQAAEATSQGLGGHPTSAQILASLVFTPLTTNTVRLDYTGGSKADQTLGVLKRYTTALLNQRLNRESTSVNQALQTLQNLPSNQQTHRIVQNESSLTQALRQLPGNFSSSFDSGKPILPQKIAAGGPSVGIAVAGGFLAGVAFFTLVALILGRVDSRVRRPQDIEVVGVPVIDVDSHVDAASVQLLRSELELAGVGTRLAVIAVTRPTRREGASGLALALARTFAGVGTPTILVSADLRARKERAEAGLTGLLDGSAEETPLIELEENLRWLPEGSSKVAPETLFSAPRVERIVRNLREHAGVVVLDSPTVLEDSETLPLMACADVVLLTVRPGASKWNPLGAAVSLIQRVAKRPLHICYDRAASSSSIPAAAAQPAAERVAQAIEVPAS
jgi:Mrp family chromosome partitioning ATPase